MTDETIIENVEPAVEAPTPEPTLGGAPWSKDIEDMGLGAKGAVVDGYLRETIQPHITKLEQELAEYRGMFENTDAAGVAAAIAYGLTNPETYRETLEHLKNELEWSDVEIAAAQQVAEEAVGTPDEPQYAKLDPEIEEFLKNQMQAQQDAEAEQILEDFYAMKAEEYGQGFDRDLYEDIFISRTNQGDDLDAIDARYKSRIEQMTPPPPPAPQVLTGGSTPSLAGEPPKTMEEAEAAFREMLASKK